MTPVWSRYGAVVVRAWTHLRITMRANSLNEDVRGDAGDPQLAGLLKAHWLTIDEELQTTLDELSDFRPLQTDRRRGAWRGDGIIDNMYAWLPYAQCDVRSISTLIFTDFH